MIYNRNNDGDTTQVRLTTSQIKVDKLIKKYPDLTLTKILNNLIDKSLKL